MKHKKTQSEIDYDNGSWLVLAIALTLFAFGAFALQSLNYGH